MLAKYWPPTYIREEQSWVLEWNNWRRWHEGVCMLLGGEVNHDELLGRRTLSPEYLCSTPSAAAIADDNRTRVQSDSNYWVSEG